MLRFGALAPQLKQQLLEYKLGIPNKASMVLYQRCADAITTLYLAQLVTQNETEKARRRLMGRILQDAVPHKR